MNQRKCKSLRSYAIDQAKEYKTGKVRLVYQALKKIYLETPRTERKHFMNS